MRSMIIVAIVVLLSAMVSSVLSQDGESLSYGESATGEITNRHFEIEYEFEAQAGDVVVMTMTPADTDAFRTPGILLLNEEYDVVGEAFDTYSVTLFHDAQASGVYYILATRNDGRSGEGVGQFSLQLSRAPVLQNGQDLCEGATSESDKHYAVRAGGDFDVSYQYLDGDFRPEVSINTIKSRGNGLEARISLTGPSLERGSIGATVRGGQSTLLIVRVGQRSWDWSDDKTADYRLRLDLGEPAEDVAVSIVASSTINVRSGPGTQFDIVGSFQSGSLDVALARNEDGSWLQTASGWVFANLVEPCGDVMQLTETSE